MQNDLFPGLELFPNLETGLRGELEALPGLIEKTFPLPGRFRSHLPGDIARLSRLLTSERGERRKGYMNEPALLSAYIRYFLPWNVYRLTKLFQGGLGGHLLQQLRPGDAVTDLGSGPLTLPIALFLACPDLRSTPLEFRCVDQSGAALDAGRRLFQALTKQEAQAWSIRLIRGDMGTSVRGTGAGLLTAINVFNEAQMNLRPDALAQRLKALIRPSGAVLVVEPGVPRSGAFISLLRSALMEKGLPPIAPCTHDADCPCPGKGMRGAKWCHFAFSTDDAPAALLRSSFAAELPKERAALSFIYAGESNQAKNDTPGLEMRILSDMFPLADKHYGRYACSSTGLALISGSFETIHNSPAGQRICYHPASGRVGNETRDPKTGALLINYSLLPTQPRQ